MLHFYYTYRRIADCSHMLVDIQALHMRKETRRKEKREKRKDRERERSEARRRRKG